MRYLSGYEIKMKVFVALAKHKVVLCVWDIGIVRDDGYARIRDRQVLLQDLDIVLSLKQACELRTHPTVSREINARE